MSRKPITNWAKIDWSLTNEAIAKSLTCSETVVKVNRKKHAPEHLKSTMSWMAADRTLDVDWLEVSDWGETNSMIAERIGCSVQTVRRHRPVNARARQKLVMQPLKFEMDLWRAAAGSQSVAEWLRKLANRHS